MDLRDRRLSSSPLASAGALLPLSRRPLAVVVPMNWIRLLEVIAMAFARTGNQPKVDRGWGWVCYCEVCRALREIGV